MVFRSRYALIIIAAFAVLISGCGSKAPDGTDASSSASEPAIPVVPDAVVTAPPEKTLDAPPDKIAEPEPLLANAPPDEWIPIERMDPNAPPITNTPFELTEIDGIIPVERQITIIETTVADTSDASTDEENTEEFVPPSDAGYIPVTIKYNWSLKQTFQSDLAQPTYRKLTFAEGQMVLASLSGDQLVLEYGSPTGFVQLQNAAGQTMFLLRPGDKIRITGFMLGRAEFSAAMFRQWYHGKEEAIVRLGLAIYPYITNIGERRLSVVVTGGTTVEIPKGRGQMLQLGNVRILPGTRNGAVLSNLGEGFCEEWIIAGGHSLRVGIGRDGDTYLWKGGAGTVEVPINDSGTLNLSEGAGVRITGGVAVAWNKDGIPILGIVKKTEIENLSSASVFLTDSNRENRIPIGYQDRHSLYDL